MSDDRLLDSLRARLGDRVRVDEDTRAAHRADAWMLSELRDFQSRPGPLPKAVVLAGSTEDVSHTLATCRAARVPVIPYGGGSGVCGGIEPDTAAIVLSTRGLQGLVSLSDRDLTATFRAGTMGIDAENRVQQDGLTIGHWPQSIELSTVGGWVATRAAGQFSTAYGNIEDVLLALEMVLPDGRVLRTRDTPRAAAGPDLRQLVMGSEGTLGVVTEVTFSLRPLPGATRGQTFHFADLASGLEAIRKFMRAGWRPPVVRLYDARESRRHFREFVPKGRHALILHHEGPTGLVAAEVDGVAGICSAVGGEATSAAAVDQWMGSRNHVPSFRSFLEQGVVVDTIEVATTWSRVDALYERVTSSLGQVPGIVSATAHSSHSYRSGTNLYFSFAARPDDASQLEATYLECWRRTMEATVEVGGGIAHHHGIGRVRRAHLEREIGSVGVDVLRGVQRGLDPDGLLNPGNLLPPA